MARALSFIRRARLYIKHDLVEIVAPRSIPNPPGYVPPERTSLRDLCRMLYQGTRLYIDTWDSQKLDKRLAEHYGEEYVKERGEKEAARKEWQEVVEGFGSAARGGGKAMVPFLQNLYTSRAAAFGEALKQFVVGYREGLAQGVEAAPPPELPTASGQAAPGAGTGHRQDTARAEEDDVHAGVTETGTSQNDASGSTPTSKPDAPRPSGV